MQDHIEATLLLGYVFGAICELSRCAKGNVLQESIIKIKDEMAVKIERLYYTSKD